MKVAFYTLGCKVNQYETSAMEQMFIKKGYEICNFEEKPDIAIVNTCTVTNMSDRKSRQILRRLKNKNKNLVLVAIGCYAQVCRNLLKNIEEIDLILGNTEKKDIVKYVENFIKNKNKIIKISDISKEKQYTDLGITTYTEKTRANIKIQDGCNNFCSYCLIPYARGRIRSRNPKNIIEEVSIISKKGIKEIVITGINIASYGKDFENNYRLIDLLEDLDKIEDIKRIRLGSLEPTIITKEWAERTSKLNKICNHFHLSLQSGCNETLKRMNRHYNIEDFRNVTKILRKYFKDVMLTTDIIVGFPGESEEEFNKTYEFLKEIKFYKMHVFKYSKRDGTVAEKMPNQILGNIKEERSNILIELSNKNEKEYQEIYKGKKMEVLFEEKHGEYYVGHTKNYMLVKYKTDEDLENQIKNISMEKFE